MSKIPRIEKEIIEHVSYKGFYKHPTLPIWLSKTEDDVITRDGKIPAASGGEYKSFGKHHLHVLKLETFLEKPDDKLKVYGNHTDGIKHNNLLDNLEWTTISGNISHAYESGLRNDNLTGFIKDLTTGDVRMFYSLRSVCNELNVNPPRITNYLKKDRTFPFEWKYSIWLLGEKPSMLSKEDVGKARRGTVKPFYLRNKQTDDKHYFVYKRDAMKKLGLVSNDIRNIKRHRHQEWEYCEITDPNILIDVLKTDERHNQILKENHLKAKSEELDKTSGKVKVTNLLDNTMREYQSVYSFANINNYDVSSINRTLRKGKVWRTYLIENLE